MEACTCNNSLGNTGVPGCQPLFKVAKKELYIPIYDSTGALNKVDLSIELTQAVLDAHLNNADASKRWYPTPILENYTSERGESVFDEAPSGNKDFLKSGTRSESYEIRNQAGAYKGQLEKARCFEVGKLVVDVNNSLRGMFNSPTGDGYLYPIKIDNNSFDVNYNFQIDTSVNKLVVSYDYDQTQDDSLLRMISGASIPANLLAANGLLDIYSEAAGTVTTTGFTLQLNTIFGDAAVPVPDTGLLIGDFAIAELSPVPGAVTITTVTETPALSGTYVFVIAAETIGDVLEVTPSGDGKDYTNVIANTLTITA